MHLTPEQLVDVADGTLAESALSEVEGHLATCAECRRQLADMRGMMALASDADLPEPSPLFWDHLSARVSEAVAAEPARGGWNWWVRAALPFALGTAAAVAIALLLVSRVLAPGGDTRSTVAWHAEAPPLPAATETLAPDVTDPSLALVADLTQDLGWDERRDAGLAPRGSAEHAVTHLSEPELRELKELLQTEMGKSSD
jgi:hypothetical protein